MSKNMKIIFESWKRFLKEEDKEDKEETEEETGENAWSDMINQITQGIPDTDLKLNTGAAGGAAGTGMNLGAAGQLNPTEDSLESSSDKIPDEIPKLKTSGKGIGAVAAPTAASKYDKFRKKIKINAKKQTKLINMLNSAGAVMSEGGILDKIARDPKVGALKVTLKGLQEALMSLGYKFPKFGADGDYGTETYRAIKKFQEDNPELGTPDGLIGNNTFRVLKAKMLKKNKKRRNIKNPALKARVATIDKAMKQGHNRKQAEMIHHLMTKEKMSYEDAINDERVKGSVQRNIGIGTDIGESQKELKNIIRRVVNKLLDEKK
jgi:hypothetical protein